MKILKVIEITKIVKKKETVEYIDEDDSIKEMEVEVENEVGSGKYIFISEETKGTKITVKHCKDHEHDSEIDACDCYRKWQLKNTLKLDNKGTERPCQHPKCGNITDKFASLEGGAEFYLCENDMTEEVVESLVKFGEVFQIVK